MKMTNLQQTVLISLKVALERATEAHIWDLLEACPEEYHAGLLDHVVDAIDASEIEEEKTYKIMRFYRDMNRTPDVQQTGLTLEEAQAHCRRPDTAGDSFFDGYEEE